MDRGSDGSREGGEGRSGGREGWKKEMREGWREGGREDEYRDIRPESSAQCASTGRSCQKYGAAPR